MSGRVVARSVDALEERLTRLEGLLEAAAAKLAAKPQVIPLERTDEPVVGWRVWAVFPWEDVTGRKGARLGSYNGHHAWVPRQALHAACNGLLTGDRKHHDAPQLGCHCGVWAFRTSELLADELDFMRDWMHEHVGVDAEYAVGQVRLWGRVLEFEKGFRAEKAYPYALTVFSEEEATARMLRSEYLVDVDWQAWEPLPEPETEAEQEAPEPERPEPVHLGPLTDDDVLVGLVTAIGYNLRRRTCSRSSIERSLIATTCDFWVTEALYWERGLPDVSRREIHGDTLTAVTKGLKRLMEQGLVERGLPRTYHRSFEWRLTAAGLEYARASIPKNRAVVLPENFSRPREDVRVAELLDRIEEAPESLFAHEIEQERAEWTPRRLQARKTGRVRYEAWLEKQRKTVRGRLRLYYGDDEILAAVTEASRMSVRRGRGDLVEFVPIMDRLAPGKYTTEERCPVAYALTRLVKAEQLERGTPNGKPAWAPIINSGGNERRVDG